MKVGCIDIGTNSMRLLLANYKDDSITDRKKYVNSTRIGQGVDDKGFIKDSAMKINIDALKEYKKICDENNCDKVFCIGTSALRDAKNSDEFIYLAKKEANIDVEIITGEDEAYLGFNGVLQGIKEKENILVIDIGGGSTEFIFGDECNIKFSKSEDIGAVRMTERFLNGSLSKDLEIIEMDKYINEKIDETVKTIKKYNINKVIGIGGTATSISAINQELEVYSMEKIHNSIITLDEVKKILHKIKNMTLNDKKRVKGLQEKRADIIVAGVEILYIIMKNLEIDSITVSEYDNLEGLVHKKMGKMS